LGEPRGEDVIVRVAPELAGDPGCQSAAELDEGEDLGFVEEGGAGGGVACLERDSERLVLDRLQHQDIGFAEQKQRVPELGANDRFVGEQQ
jgi:hypothetical protein